MEHSFTAHNELETRLIAAQHGELDSDEFMHGLLDAQLFMPVQDEPGRIQGFQRSTRANPLTLQSEDGFKVLVLFSSPERAKTFVQDHPGYGGGLLVEFSWVLARLGSGVAVSINPDLDYGIDLDPDTVEQLIHLNASRGTGNAPD